MHHWFKSYGDFAENVDFDYWWSCIRKGLLSTGLPSLVYSLLDEEEKNYAALSRISNCLSYLAVVLTISVE